MGAPTTETVTAFPRTSELGIMNLVNLTPHTISIHTAGGAVVLVPATGSIARVASNTVHVMECPISGISLYAPAFGAVEGLPDPKTGTIYIVSAMVRERVPSRLDVASPGALVRDANGQPIGCNGLAVNLPEDFDPCNYCGCPHGGGNPSNGGYGSRNGTACQNCGLV